MSKVLRLLSIVCLGTLAGLTGVTDRSALGQQAPSAAPTPAPETSGPAPLAPPSLETPPDLPPAGAPTPRPAAPAPPAETPAAQAPVPAQAPPDTVGKPAPPLTRGPASDDGFVPVQNSTPKGAPLDEQVQQVQAKPGGEPELDPSKLPPAKDRPGGAPPALKGEPEAPGATAAFDNSPERYPIGRQALAMSVEVEAPQVINLGQQGTIKLYVGNNGQADARGVRLNYMLPQGLELVSAQPECIDPKAPTLSWNLTTIHAGGDPKLVTLRVRAVGVKQAENAPASTLTVDHVATVTLITGARSRTEIREPKLKVEAIATPAKVLKGQQSVYKITVSNPGTGPARKVVLEATLTSGLEVPQVGKVVSKSLGTIQPGESIVIEGGLIVDALAGGEQSCTFIASSPDVEQNDLSQIKSPIVVVQPELTMKLQGQTKRFTDTTNEYAIEVTNPGSSPARNVKVEATIPRTNGRLMNPVPEGAEWNIETRKLTWIISQLDVGETRRMPFSVKMGSPGQYQVAVLARSGDLMAKDSLITDISGMANLDLSVQVERRVVDLGKITVFDIKIVNDGTKEASKISVKAILSDHFEILKTAGTDEQARKKKDSPELWFPEIDRLEPNGELILSVQVKTLKPGIGNFRVFVEHDGKKDETIESVATTKITDEKTFR